MLRILRLNLKDHVNDYNGVSYEVPFAVDMDIFAQAGRDPIMQVWALTQRPHDNLWVGIKTVTCEQIEGDFDKDLRIFTQEWGRKHANKS